jgi:hypothetical protein
MLYLLFLHLKMEAIEFELPFQLKLEASPKQELNQLPLTLPVESKSKKSIATGFSFFQLPLALASGKMR